MSYARNDKMSPAGAPRQASLRLPVLLLSGLLLP